MQNQDVNSILIIGAHGMLGRPVARRLVQNGFQVKALARNVEAAKKALPGEVQVVFGNLMAADSIDKALDGCGAVYVSVDTPPGAAFHPETEGLKNVVTAAKNHPGVRLLVLSALRGSDPQAQHHPWWHAREKYEAQQIAKNSGLPWTIFEPSWFMETLPLLVKFKILSLIQTNLKAYWVAGDDLGRMISAALKKNIGQNEIVPVQGPHDISLTEAAFRFVHAYDPSIFLLPTPLGVIKMMGLVMPKLRELGQLFDLFGDIPETVPNPGFWNKFAKPEMTIETYAQYVKLTGDFPQK
jgi:uncharacterized protein YbjT (DUF2867 family)